MLYCGRKLLTGVVENLKAKKAAEQDAKNTLGVKRVKNYITVRPSISPTDAEIAQKVQEALLRDSITERHQITVNVLNKKVNLSGTVDPYTNVVTIINYEQSLSIM